MWEYLFHSNSALGEVYSVTVLFVGNVCTSHSVYSWVMYISTSRSCRSTSRSCRSTSRSYRSTSRSCRSTSRLDRSTSRLDRSTSRSCRRLEIHPGRVVVHPGYALNRKYIQVSRSYMHYKYIHNSAFSLTDHCLETINIPRSFCVSLNLYHAVSVCVEMWFCMLTIHVEQDKLHPYQVFVLKIM